MPRKTREPIILTLDTETIGLDGALKRIAIYDGVKVTRGYTFDDVLPEIERYYNDGYMPRVFIHNADFDLKKLPQVFERGNVVWSRTKLIGNKYARVHCKKYVIQDSFKLLPNSLKNLSRDFELEHGKKDLWEEVQKVYPGQYVDHVDFLSRCDPDDPLYLEYLDYDVISLYELIMKLMEISKIPLADFVKLLSTASMSKYLMKNGWGDVVFHHEGEKVTDFEKLVSCQAWSTDKTMRNTNLSYLEIEGLMRYGFYGGRTEVFTPYLPPHNGEVQAYHYDINSEYPSAMCLEQRLGERPVSVGKMFPIGYPMFEEEPILVKNEYDNWLDTHNGLGFICADVFVPDQTIPPLPAKLGKLTFVCGHITGCWTYTELEYAILNCGVEIENYHYIVHFKNTFPVFENFVNCFYKIKTDGKKGGNASLTAFAKLILNTAYGWT